VVRIRPGRRPQRDLLARRPLARRPLARRPSLHGPRLHLPACRPPDPELAIPCLPTRTRPRSPGLRAPPPVLVEPAPPRRSRRVPPLPLSERPGSPRSTTSPVVTTRSGELSRDLPARAAAPARGAQPPAAHRPSTASLGTTAGDRSRPRYGRDPATASTRRPRECRRRAGTCRAELRRVGSALVVANPPPLTPASRAQHHEPSITTSSSSHRPRSAISRSIALLIALVNDTSAWTAATRRMPADRSAAASSFPTRRSPYRIGSA
jgi:hypothetical protein